MRTLRPLQPRPEHQRHSPYPFEKPYCINHKLRCENAAPELERIARGFISAINRRCLSSSAPEWQPISPNFRASFDQDPDKTLNREEYLRWLRSITSSNPDHLIRVMDIATYVDEDKGRAEVWMTGTTSSPTHRHIVHQCVKVLEFAFSQDHGWLCVRYKRMRGPLGAEAVY